MENLVLQAEPRTLSGKKVRRLREQGIIPAVLYGKEVEPRPLQLRAIDLDRVLRHGGMNRLLTLNIAGEKDSFPVLIREVQRDPIHRRLIHADFYAVVMSEKVRTSVPIELVGESPLVASGQAMIVQSLDEVEIECYPDKLVSVLEVDATLLNDFDAVLHVGDVTPPEGIEILTDADEVIASLQPVGGEVEEEEEAAVEAGEVEVISRRKEEEEEE